MDYIKGLLLGLDFGLRLGWDHVGVRVSVRI